MRRSATSKVLAIKANSTLGPKADAEAAAIPLTECAKNGNSGGSSGGSSS